MGAEWKVLPHGQLTELVPGRLWSVRGSLPDMPLPRNMIVWRLPDGKLLLHSVICLDEAGMTALAALGEPRVMIVPNEGHRLDATAWKARFPQIRVLCPANARAKVEEVIQADGTCEDELPAEGVKIHVPPGFKEAYELVYEVDVGDGHKALLVNDVLAHGERIPGFQGFLLGLLGVPGGGFGRPRIVSFFFGKDRGRFKPFVESLAARDDLVALTVSHGPPVVGKDEVRASLTAAAAKL
jgi:hypothetical protein